MSDTPRNDLPEALQIKGPHALKGAPTAYSFTRSRALGNDEFWSSILNLCGISEDDVERGLAKQRRELFEAAWFGNGPRNATDKLEENIKTGLAEHPAWVHDPATVYSTVAAEQVESKLFIFGRLPATRSYRRAPFAKDAIAITAGCVLRLPARDGQDRWYLPLRRGDQDEIRPAQQAEFFPGNADETWNNIVELIPVSYIPPGASPDATERAKKLALDSFTAFEVVRADAALIHKQYKKLDKEKKLADALNAKGEKLLTENNGIPNSLFEAIPTLTAQYRSLVSMQPEVEELQIRLADAASALGYKLVLAPETVEYYQQGTGTKLAEPLKPGELYRTEQRTVSWQTSHQEKSHSTRGFLGKRRWHYRTVLTSHQRSFVYYEKVEPDYDPWVEAADQYRADGYQVFLLRPDAAGFATTDGVTLAEIQERCRDSETFRRKCVVGIPFFEDTIVGERLMIGYRLVFRPTVPLVNERFPVFSTEEKLSYRLAWCGTSLGEMVASIPLAPGEERQVTIQTTQKFSTSRSIKTSSLAEITRVDREDFETLFEAEVRKEKETTKSAGGSAGGSYGGFSGSANFSTTTTTKDMSRQLNRSVARASQEVTRKNKESVEVSITEERQTDTSSSTSFKVRNINVGRTLNINLYKVLNDFVANLVLEDFDFNIEAGPYLAELPSFRETRQFSRSNLGALFEFLAKPGILPLDISGIEARFFAAFVSKIAAAIKVEYTEESASASSQIAAREAIGVHDLMSRDQMFPETDTGKAFSIVTLPQVASELIANAPADEGAEALRLLSRAFSTPNMMKDGLLNVEFEPVRFSYDAGAFHADSQVGLIASTEAFSERMRLLEEKGAEAQQELIRARADLLRARAKAQLPAATPES